MPNGDYATTHIPPEQVDNVVAGFELDKPSSIEKIKQADGNWTVIARWPRDQVL